MTDLERVLADRYAIERELGQGGMATVYLHTRGACTESRATPDLWLVTDFDPDAR